MVNSLGDYMKDDYLEELSYEIDDDLVKLMNKYKVSPLSLSSILLARLMRLNMETASLNDFKSIMSLALTKNDERVLQ